MAMLLLYNKPNFNIIDIVVIVDILYIHTQYSVL